LSGPTGRFALLVIDNIHPILRIAHAYDDSTDQLVTPSDTIFTV
jgi:hypothetical protein